MRLHSWSWVGLCILVGGGSVGGCISSGDDDCALTETCKDESRQTDASVDEVDTSGLGRGALCAVTTDCGNGFCVDGVCCNRACDGICERCDLAGLEGQCSPVQAGADPDGECVDRGDTTGLCGGTCDGNRGCSFPGAATPCGISVCDSGTHRAEVCNGSGTCSENVTSCGQYACGDSACRNRCDSGSDCVATAYCRDGECFAQKEDGEACEGADACTSGFCVEGVCCATACGAPSSCGTGTCLCAGGTCATGQACTVWQLDLDGDGYPASSDHDVVACTDARPPNWSGRKYYDIKVVAIDCDDNDLDVHPNQVQYFTEPRKNGGGFDYDCDGQETRRYETREFFGQCRSCTFMGSCRAGFGLPADPCDQLLSRAFTGTYPVACGQSATMMSCSPLDPVQCESPISKSSSAQQGCR